MLRQVGHQQGMRINEPIHVQIDDDETDTYANALRSNLHEQVNDLIEFCLIFDSYLDTTCLIYC
jgi:hypothetical protein